MRRIHNHGEEQKQMGGAIGSDLKSSICVSCFGEISDQNSQNLKKPLENDMRHSLRSNRLEAVSLDSAVVRIQEQAMDGHDEY